MVVFNSVEEFINELKLERDAVEQGILRATFVGEAPAGGIYPYKHLSVVAGFVAHGQVVRLRAYCGQLWPGENGEEEVWQRTQEIMDRLRQAAQELGLEMRPGLLVSPEEAGASGPRRDSGDQA